MKIGSSEISVVFKIYLKFGSSNALLLDQKLRFITNLWFCILNFSMQA